jgi:hypothetical protein
MADEYILNFYFEMLHSVQNSVHCPFLIWHCNVVFCGIC